MDGCGPVTLQILHPLRERDGQREPEQQPVKCGAHARHLSYIPPNASSEALPPKVTAFAESSFKEVK